MEIGNPVILLLSLIIFFVMFFVWVAWLINSLRKLSYQRMMNIRKTEVFFIIAKFILLFYGVYLFFSLNQFFGNF